MWNFGWITKWLSEFPTIAAQKEKYETQIMLLNAKHETAVQELQTRNTVLEDENSNLRAELQRKHEEIDKLERELQRCVHLLENDLNEAEHREPPIAGADAGS
jgi:predicted  nucleic acid-binding Zn-ribbon protein